MSALAEIFSLGPLCEIVLELEILLLKWGLRKDKDLSLWSPEDLWDSELVHECQREDHGHLESFLNDKSPSFSPHLGQLFGLDPRQPHLYNGAQTGPLQQGIRG